MNVNDKLHGFVVREIRPLPEISAEMIMMEYEKNRAQLMWLKRDDDNKTFSITFKTVPDDSTGVFHILEHSVLNGSKKYPVKEPFVELIKGSLQTFLNAFTFPDKTLYPVCSKNDKDFLNLMDVYLDAVLHPLSIYDPHAFLQEGHHLELESPEGELTRNGVVFSEMKGAYSDPDTLLSYEISRLLFPDNCYGYDSGGHPEHIPELTYEKYKACHERFYHPSNSRVFLDGNVDIDSVLAKIDEFFSEYDYLEIDSRIEYQSPVESEPVTVFYPVTSEDGLDSKAMLGEGWVYGTFDENIKLLACSAISRLLCGSNESPLTKALLEKDLCEDVSFQQLDGVQQLIASLVIHNAKCDKSDEIRSVIKNTLKEQSEKGLDREMLHNILTRMEFTARENDFAGYPTGLIFNFSAMDAWLYGGDPESKLCVGDIYDRLHRKLDEGYFEELLREVFIDNPHHASVTLLPSLTVAAENAEKEKKALSELKAQMNEAEINEVIDTFKKLRIRQNEPDTEEKLNMLPKLNLSDIPEKCSSPVAKKSTVDGRTVLNCDVNTNGITHVTLMFRLPDVKQEDLSELSFVTSLIGNIGTKRHELLKLKSMLDAGVGRFSVSSTAHPKKYNNNDATPYVFVTVSLLEHQKKALPELLRELLFDTDFSQTQQIRNLLKQSVFGMEQSIIQSGSSFSVGWLDGSCTRLGALTDSVRGITKFRSMQALDRDFDKLSDTLADKYSDICETVFSKNRVSVGITGKADDEFISSILNILSDAPIGRNAVYSPFEKRDLGLVIPSEIGYGGMSAYIENGMQELDGVSKIASQLLTYGFLWNEIRVKGGAYGTGLSVNNGQLHISSYRDPSPSKSLDTFKTCAKALREFCRSDEPIDKYIISTIAGFDPLLSPSLSGLVTFTRYIMGIDNSDRQRIYSSILSCGKTELLRFADVLECLTDNAKVCIIGGEALIPEFLPNDKL